MPKCPICKSELIPVGYPDELGFQKYRCPNGCKFSTPLSWKIHNAVATVVIVALMLFFFLPVSLIVGAFVRLKSLLRRR